MSTKSDLEGEDFDKVTLVRMEDIQPSRGHQIVKYVKDLPVEIESYTEDPYIKYLDDEDSNIGSMVTITSETVPIEHNYSEKYIVPDLLAEIPLEIEKIEPEKPKVKVEPSNSWPTLEILPGGVIKHAGKIEDQSLTNNTVEDSCLIKMYACARCSNSYRDLYSLVKHVKCHKDEKKMEDYAKLSTVEDDWCKLKQTGKKKLVTEKKSNKKRVAKRRKI